MRPAFEPAAGLGRAHPHETTPRSIDADVAIIGAGPVGLMIANILGLQGVRVVVVEKLTQIIDYPRAIGLDDEALRVFQSVGLAGRCCRTPRRITGCASR
jgi:3-(3-hydroxy-phenyl)propionate hydroxylase